MNHRSEHSNASSASLSPDDLLREIDRLEGKLDALRAEVDESTRLATLGLMAATLAHELRNVLTPVLGYAQMARQKTDDQQLVEKSLEKIVSGLETAHHIVRSTLDQAAGEPSSNHRTSADVHTCVHRAIACTQLELRRTRARTDVDVLAGLCAAIAPHRLEQVLVNLILNSAAALSRSSNGARPRDREIRIIAKTLADRGAVQITVMDNGPGFAPGFAERAFDPFVTSPARRFANGTRGQAPSRQSRVGSGLGLAICRRIITEAGGTIAAGGGAQGGAVVRMTLPATSGSLRKAG